MYNVRSIILHKVTSGNLYNAGCQPVQYKVEPRSLMVVRISYLTVGPPQGGFLESDNLMTQ